MKIKIHNIVASSKVLTDACSKFDLVIIFSNAGLLLLNCLSISSYFSWHFALERHLAFESLVAILLLGSSVIRVLYISEGLNTNFSETAFCMIVSHLSLFGPRPQFIILVRSKAEDKMMSWFF